MSQKMFGPYSVIATAIAVGLVTWGVIANMQRPTHPTPTSTAVSVNNTGGITDAEADSLQVGDLLCRNDGLIVAIANVTDGGSIHCWSKDIPPARHYIIHRLNIQREFTEVYKLGTIQWKWAAEFFFTKQ